MLKTYTFTVFLFSILLQIIHTQDGNNTVDKNCSTTKYIYDEDLQTCVRDCSKVLNSIFTNPIDNIDACVCIENF